MNTLELEYLQKITEIINSIDTQIEATQHLKDHAQGLVLKKVIEALECQPVKNILDY